MDERTIEDRLRKEYFELLPDIRRVAEHLETEIKYHLLRLSRSLKKHEHIVVKSRIKECDSAIESLRRRAIREGGAGESGIFDIGKPHAYTLTSLRDLAGVRVLAFPEILLSKIDQELQRKFGGWKSDPIPGKAKKVLAPKYYGLCSKVSKRIRGEYQVVPMLIGLFWEVEHSAIYKPSPDFKGIAQHPTMQKRTEVVLQALSSFEKEFGRLARKSKDS